MANNKDNFSTYSAAIIKATPKIERAIKGTIKIYRDAVSYCAEIVYKHLDDLTRLQSKEKINYVEKLIHTTNKNQAIYPFDKKFHKMPSYFRRGVISTSIGIVSSYSTRLKEYEKEKYDTISNGKKFKKKPPQLVFNTNEFPSFYKGNMYENDGNWNINVKLFINHDWKYVSLQLRNQDKKYIDKKLSTGAKIKNPSIVYSYGKYRLAFPFEEMKQIFTDTPIEDRLVLSVDLGVNCDAVCSVVQGDGTILDRFFIDQTSDKTHMYRLLNKLKKLQKQSGTKAEQKKIWTKINGYRKNITNQVVNEIIKIAIAYNVDVVVLENLSKMKPKGSKKQKIALWNKKKISEKIKQKVHKHGIRYSFINPRNTSALAFDGSGKVERDSNNYSIYTFPSGKKYNSDLNASYNIAARYFIREYEKSIEYLNENQWLELQAKVPGLPRRIDCTLCSLKHLVLELKAI